MSKELIKELSVVISEQTKTIDHSIKTSQAAIEQHALAEIDLINIKKDFHILQATYAGMAAGRKADGADTKVVTEFLRNDNKKFKGILTTIKNSIANGAEVSPMHLLWYQEIEKALDEN